MIIFLLFFTKNLFAKELKTSAKTIQTTISSDIIDIKKKSQKIDFISNVIVERQDISMLADRMTVYYIEKNIKNNFFILLIVLNLAL